MPCYRCGARQTDPVRGPSAWKRSVRGDVQVLVCPDCQHAYDWVAEMDRCAACGSTMLVRLLGETHCRSCGVIGGAAAISAQPRGAASVPATASTSSRSPSGDREGGLARDVQAALDRLFGRG